MTDLAPAALAWQCVVEGETGDLERGPCTAYFSIYVGLMASFNIYLDWAKAPQIAGLHVTKWSLRVAAGKLLFVTLTLAGDTRSD